MSCWTPNHNSILLTGVVLLGSAAALSQNPAPMQSTRASSQAPAAKAASRTAAPQQPSDKPDVLAIKKKAEAGDPAAASQLGDLLAIGTGGVQRDFASAVKWYRKAAESGDLRGQTKVAMLYEGGFGVTRDLKQAVSWYEKAAAQKDTAAMMRLANLYKVGGPDFEPNEAESFKWLTKAAELGVTDAQIALGDAYLEGISGIVQPDPSQTMKWYRAAASQNDATAIFLVGRLYEQGKGVPASTEEATKWYQEAIRKGSPQAKAALRRLQF